MATIDTSPPLLPPGRILLTLVALMTSTACYIADWNESHIYNHTWPGHAKFHNGQTMSMGLLLGVAALYYIYREPLRVDLPPPAPSSSSTATTTTTVKAQALSANRDSAVADPHTLAHLQHLRQRAALANLNTVALLNSLYWITQLSAHWYPQVTAFDPVPGSARFGEHQDPHLQKKLDVSFFAVTAAGWWLERRRIGRGDF
ncbi:hypothetical protein IWZ01DRAFT_355202 [Phyllosticta capitalensis]